jgi:hypothetical protein
VRVCRMFMYICVGNAHTPGHPAKPTLITN